MYMTNCLQVAVALQEVPYQDSYPMDYYASQSLGAWTVNNERHRSARAQRKHVAVETETVAAPRTDS